MSPLIDCCVDYTENAETVLLDDGIDAIQINAIASMWAYTIVQWSNADTRASIAWWLVAAAIRKPCSLRESGEGPMKTAAAVAHSLRTPFVVEDVELPDQRNGIAIKPILELAAQRLGEMK